jgi:hypothetical protein
MGRACGRTPRCSPLEVRLTKGGPPRFLGHARDRSHPTSAATSTASATAAVPSTTTISIASSITPTIERLCVVGRVI